MLDYTTTVWLMYGAIMYCMWSLGRLLASVYCQRQARRPAPPEAQKH